MDTIKLMTIDGREVTFIGRDFAAMLRLVKAIPGARFIGTLKEYGELHTYNHWEVPFMYRDVAQHYGPFAALRAITTWQLPGEDNRLTEEEFNELIATRPAEGNPMSVAYRAGRDGVPEPDFQDPALGREYEEGCRIRLETDLYRGVGPWWHNANTGTYQMLLENRRILTVDYSTMAQAISERRKRESCSLDAAYQAELADVDKWLALAQVRDGAYIIDVAADEAMLRAGEQEMQRILQSTAHQTLEEAVNTFWGLAGEEGGN